MAGGPSEETLDRLRRPIPLPKQFSELRYLQDSLKAKAQRAQALRSLAEVSKMPQWAEVRNRASGVIANLLDALPRVMGQERDQMIGEITAWRQFAASPDEALESVRKLDSEIGELEASIRPHIEA